MQVSESNKNFAKHFSAYNKKTSLLRIGNDFVIT